MPADQDDIAGALAAATRRHLPGATGIGGLRRLTGGANKETWAFDAETAQGSLPLILRRQPGGSGGLIGSAALPIAIEAEVVAAAARAGVPAPELRFVLEEADNLGGGFVMARIAGETVARRILRDALYAEARPRLAAQCGAALARIHALDAAGLPDLPRGAARERLDQLHETYAGFDDPRPVFALAFAWLARNVPEPGPLRLVHGDFRLGNFVVGPEGLRAVLDWEGAHFGDPAEDFGWICVPSWRFGVLDLPVGGFGTRADLIGGYEAAGGGPIAPARRRWWEVFGILRWGITCMAMGYTHLRGADRSVERAAIGRRASETEIDLLRILAPERGR